MSILIGIAVVVLAFALFIGFGWLMERDVGPREPPWGRF